MSGNGADKNSILLAVQNVLLKASRDIYRLPLNFPWQP